MSCVIDGGADKVTGQSIKILTLFLDIISGGVVNVLRRGMSRDARAPMVFGVSDVKPKSAIFFIDWMPSLMILGEWTWLGEDYL